MDIILYYIRDNLVGTHYFIYSFILLFFIIGYLFKQKYGKLDIILNTSQTDVKKKMLEGKEEQKSKEVTSNKKKRFKHKENNIIENAQKEEKNNNSVENQVVKNNTTSTNNVEATPNIISPQLDETSSIMIQSTTIPTLKEMVSNKQVVPNPSILPNVGEQNINPKPMPNTNGEAVTPTPLKKEIEQDLTGAIPEIKF